MNADNCRRTLSTAYVIRYVVPLLLLGGMTLTACLPQADGGVAATKNAGGPSNAVLVIAADRGFMGNEEIRNALARVEYANKHLIFVTDADSARYLQDFQSGHVTDDTDTVTVLPLFLSAHAPKWQWTRQWLEDNLCAQVDCHYSTTFGESYYAVEALAETLKQSHAHGDELLVLSSGADNDASAQAVAADIQRIANWAARPLGFSSPEIAVWQAVEDDVAWDRQAQQIQAKLEGDNKRIVTYHLGQKLDSMMSLDNTFARLAHAAGNHLTVAPVSENWMALWLQREVNRSRLDQPGTIGVVVHAHGSDFHWNETMRKATASLEEKYLVEYAFSMADQATIDTALSRLQQRGAKGAVVVRVFGRSDSFQANIEGMLGMDVERGGEAPMSASRGMGHHGGMSSAGSRIATPLVVTSVGGLDAHPLFGKALLERARELSENPGRETVILVAHGTGDDEANTVWLENLDQLAQQIDQLSDGAFRDIQYATWREDWPDKRDQWVAKVRSMVEAAGQNNGAALVIPARTNATGPEHEFLDGLAFKLGEGFAPHPLFAEWLEAQIQQGGALLRQGKVPPQG